MLLRLLLLRLLALVLLAVVLGRSIRAVSILRLSMSLSRKLSLGLGRCRVGGGSHDVLLLRLLLLVVLLLLVAFSGGRVRGVRGLGLVVSHCVRLDDEAVLRKYAEGRKKGKTAKSQSWDKHGVSN